MRPARKREIVDHVRAAWQVSIRRACRALPVDRSTYHYRSKRAGQAPLSKRIKRSPRPGCATAFGAFTYCFGGKAGRSTPSACTVSTANKACNCAINRPNGGSKPSCVRIVAGHHSQPDLGHGLCPRPAVRRNQDPYPDHRRHLHPALAGDRCAAELPRGRCRRTLERVSRQLAIPRPSVSTTGRNSSARSSTYGLSCTTLRSTSAGQASPPTMLSSRA